VTDADAPSPEARRPRPQYGEYATPEEQRARIRQPAPEQRAPSMPPPQTPRPVVAPAIRTARPRLLDRVVTLVLLGYGLVMVVTSIPTFVDYGVYAGQLLSILGLDVSLSDPAAGRGYGIAAAVVLAVLWLAAALLSWMSLARRRLTWWIPLVAGVVANLVTGVILTVPLMNDPAVWSALTERLGGTG